MSISPEIALAGPTQDDKKAPTNFKSGHPNTHFSSKNFDSEFNWSNGRKFYYCFGFLLQLLAGMIACQS
jgi:hypothetical protein